MKDYLWVSVAAIFAVIAMLFFVLTIQRSLVLIKKLKRKKINVLANFLIFIIGTVDIYFVVHLIMSVKEQLDMINTL